MIDVATFMRDSSPAKIDTALRSMYADEILEDRNDPFRAVKVSMLHVEDYMIFDDLDIHQYQTITEVL